MNISVGEIILLYCCDNHYKELPLEKESEYAASFKERININNVNSTLKNLKKRGYLAYQLPSERLRVLKKEELKCILQLKHITDTGNKNDLINRIKNEFSEAELVFHTDKKYKITLLGKQALEKYEYVVFLYTHNSFVVTIDDFMDLINRYPNRSWRDLMWGKLQQITMDLFNNGSDQFISGYFNQAEFLEYEKRYKDAFNTYITVCNYNVSFPKLMKERFIASGLPCDTLNEMVAERTPWDYIPKGVLKRAKECSIKASLSEEEMFNIVKANFDRNPPLLDDDNVMLEVVNYIMKSLTE